MGNSERGAWSPGGRGKAVRNAERVKRTRAALLASARRLFAERPYAEVATEEVLAGAGVTRGALYHHFADKAALFEAVCAEISAEATEAVEAAVAGADDPLVALEAGSLAWLDVMLKSETRRILLVEAPTVLGWTRWVALDEAHGFRLLRKGVAAAVEAGAIRYHAGAEALAVLLNGAMNALALRLGAGDLDVETGRAALREMIAAFSAR